MRTNLAKRRFGLLRVIKVDRIHPKQGYFWLCRCKCGTKKAVLANALLTGNTESCGCDKARKCREANTTHGMAGTPEFRAWSHMRQRCSNPTDKKYKDYGKRGIIVCDRWNDAENGFANFLADIGRRPGPGYSVERDDHNGNYEPSNCRWATAKEQANNTRRNRRFEYLGKVYTMKQLSELTGVPYPRLRWRLVEAGMPVEEAILPDDRRSNR